MVRGAPILTGQRFYQVAKLLGPLGTNNFFDKWQLKYPPKHKIVREPLLFEFAVCKIYFTK